MPDTGGRARTLAVWSLVMVPATVLTAVVAAVVAIVLLNARGLDGSEPMSVQGGYGWFVRILANGVILLVPEYVGVGLGVRSRRLGGGRLAVVGIVVNVVIVAAVWTLVLASG